jgi:hypothetical protein
MSLNSKTNSKKLIANTQPKINATSNTIGGSVMDDVNKLVVPFGLLLAEKGLSKMAKKDKKTSSSSASASRKAAVGGKTKGKKGGNLSSTGKKNLTHEFTKLSSEIETFLAKY